MDVINPLMGIKTPKTSHMNVFPVMHVNVFDALFIWFWLVALTSPVENLFLLCWWSLKDGLLQQRRYNTEKHPYKCSHNSATILLAEN